MYWTDVVQTLCAFASGFPPAAALLLQQSGAALLAELARLVGSLLPQLRSGFSAPAVQQQDSGARQGTPQSVQPDTPFAAVPLKFPDGVWHIQLAWLTRQDVAPAAHECG